MNDSNKMKNEQRLNNAKTQALNTPVVRRSFFGAKYFYIDNCTRVRYGFVLAHLGIAHTLQRKNIFWKEVAWTYARTHNGFSVDKIISYLEWYENDEKKPKVKCSF